jgi:hypothetical protein
MPSWAAARGGDFDALVAVLDPDAVLRADTGTSFREVHGAAEVAAQALTFQRFARYTQPTLVNGAAGVVTELGKAVSRLAADPPGSGTSTSRTSGKFVSRDSANVPARWSCSAGCPLLGRRTISRHRSRRWSSSVSRVV